MKFVYMILPIILLASCSDSGMVELPLENKTNISHIDCNSWYKREHLYKARCLIDNADSAETRPIRIVAYNERGAEIGEADIGKATIGLRVKINKAMIIEGEPHQLVLEVTE